MMYNGSSLQKKCFLNGSKTKLKTRNDFLKNNNKLKKKL